jgi:hypothetical protein
MQLGQILPNTTDPAITDLTMIGVGGGGPGGIGFVPPNLAGAGGLRMLTWPEGLWYHVTYATAASGFAVSAATQMEKLPGSGGFAYVPAESPGFAKQSVLVAEWDQNRVAAYEVDDQGDPVLASRIEFFTTFPNPWGAYFEPQTGDYLFLTWGGAGTDPTSGTDDSSDDHVFVVQGFKKPPPPPVAPPQLK